MITCSRCMAQNPAGARFCMACGQPLPLDADFQTETRQPAAGFGLFGLSLLGSLLISFVLMFVFKLPVLFLFGLLPLLWWKRKP